MSKRVYVISTQRDEGFMLNVVDQGPRRLLWPLVDALHFVTLHKLFYTDWAQAMMNWISDDEVTVCRIPITWEQVQEMGEGGEWEWSMFSPSNGEEPSP